MKKFIIMAAALMLGAAASAQQATETFPSFVQVTGQAELEIEPNEIYMKITIDEATSKGKVTVAEQERKMIAELTKLGINVEKDLRVGDMDGELKNYVLRKDRVETTKTYILKVTSAEMLQRAFKAMANININDLGLSKVTRSDLAELRLQLRAEAMKDARRNAESLAQAIGQTIGKAFNITDYNSFSGGEIMYDYSPSVRMAKADVMGAQEPQAEQLSFRNLKLSYSVNARFVLN